MFQNGGWAAATKTGPNDASGVVWVIGMCFFIFSLYILFYCIYMTHIYIYCLVY